jgi:hypothetical protein
MTYYYSLEKHEVYTIYGLLACMVIACIMILDFTLPLCLKTLIFAPDNLAPSTSEE